MNHDEKLTMLALAKGYRETLRQAIADADSNSKFYRQIEKLNQLVERLTDQE